MHKDRLISKCSDSWFNPDASLHQGPDQRCPIGALYPPPSSIYLSVSDLCSCNSVYVQYLNLLFIQPISLSVHYVGVHHHGSEHPRCDCDGAVLYADSGDRSVGCPKVQEGWEEEPWRSDRSGAPRRQEYQLAGWDFHHDWYVGLWGSEIFFFVMFNFYFVSRTLLLWKEKMAAVITLILLSQLQVPYLIILE